MSGGKEHIEANARQTWRERKSRLHAKVQVEAGGKKENEGEKDMSPNI